MCEDEVNTFMEEKRGLYIKQTKGLSYATTRRRGGGGGEREEDEGGGGGRRAYIHTYIHTYIEGRAV